MVLRVEISGVISAFPSGYTTLTGSTLRGRRSVFPSKGSMGVRIYVKGSAQCSANMRATMLMTIESFVSSVAVVSMKTFRVFRVILLCSELIMGGIERTVSRES